MKKCLQCSKELNSYQVKYCCSKCGSKYYHSQNSNRGYLETNIKPRELSQMRARMVEYNCAKFIKSPTQQAFNVLQKEIKNML
jgi:hypothetical protein